MERNVVPPKGVVCKLKVKPNGSELFGVTVTSEAWTGTPLNSVRKKLKKVLSPIVQPPLVSRLARVVVVQAPSARSVEGRDSSKANKLKESKRLDFNLTMTSVIDQFL